MDAPGRPGALGQPQGRLPQLPAVLHRLRGAACPTSIRATPTRRAWARSASTSTPRRGDLPAYVYMPCWLGWGQVFRRAGPYAGFLGQRYDPLTTECQPYGDKDGPPPCPATPQVVRGEPLLPNSALGADMTLDRLDHRRDLLQQIDEQLRHVEAQPASAVTTARRQRAFDLLTSSQGASGLRPEARGSAAAGPLRPHAVRPQHADRPPAGRGRACASST